MKIDAAVFQKYQQILIVCILSIGALLYGQYYYRNEKKKAQQEEYHKLQAIAKLKSEQLVQWHKERISEANFFSDGQPYKQYIYGIIEGGEKEEVLLRNSLLKIMSNNRYENIFLLDKKGKLLFSVLPDSGLMDSITEAHSRDLFSSKKIIVQDFYYCKFQKKAQYEILAPVKDGQDIIAALVFMIDPADYLYPLIQEWPTRSNSAEALIIRQEGKGVQYLSKLRDADNARLQFTFPLDQKESLAVRAVLGYTGLFEGPDYAGKRVVGDLSKVPDTPWYLIVKEDAKEVYAGFHRNFLMIVIITVLAFFYVGSTVAWMYHRRQLNLFRKMRSIFRVSHAGIGVVSDRKFKEVNPSFCEMTGYSKEELIGKGTRRLYVTQEEYNLVGKRIYSQIAEKGFGTVETNLVKKDGSVINVILAETLIDSNSISDGFAFNALDITERKKAEIAIKEKERQLSTMVSNLPGFIYRCKYDEHWTMLYISQGCLNVTGYCPDDFINNSKIAFNDIIVEEYRDVIRKKWKKGIAEKDVFEYEYQILTAKNVVRWVLERGNVVFDQDNNILFLEGYLEDITDRKNAEIELKEKIYELEKFNRIMVGRENKMIELKLEINELLSKMKLPPKYHPPQNSESLKVENQ